MQRASSSADGADCGERADAAQAECDSLHIQSPASQGAANAKDIAAPDESAQLALAADAGAAADSIHSSLEREEALAQNAENYSEKQGHGDGAQRAASRCLYTAGLAEDWTAADARHCSGGSARFLSAVSAFSAENSSSSGRSSPRLDEGCFSDPRKRPSAEAAEGGEAASCSRQSSTSSVSASRGRVLGVEGASPELRVASSFLQRGSAGDGERLDSDEGGAASLSLQTSRESSAPRFASAVSGCCCKADTPTEGSPFQAQVFPSATPDFPLALDQGSAGEERRREMAAEEKEGTADLQSPQSESLPPSPKQALERASLAGEEASTSAAENLKPQSGTPASPAAQTPGSFAACSESRLVCHLSLHSVTSLQEADEGLKYVSDTEPAEFRQVKVEETPTEEKTSLPSPEQAPDVEGDASEREPRQRSLNEEKNEQNPSAQNPNEQSQDERKRSEGKEQTHREENKIHEQGQQPQELETRVEEEAESLSDNLPERKPTAAANASDPPAACREHDGAFAKTSNSKLPPPQSTPRPATRLSNTQRQLRAILLASLAERQQWESQHRSLRVHPHLQQQLAGGGRRVHLPPQGARVYATENPEAADSHSAAACVDGGEKSDRGSDPRRPTRKGEWPPEFEQGADPSAAVSAGEAVGFREEAGAFPASEEGLPSATRFNRDVGVGQTAQSRGPEKGHSENPVLSWKAAESEPTAASAAVAAPLSFPSASALVLSTFFKQTLQQLSLPAPAATAASASASVSTLSVPRGGGQVFRLLLLSERLLKELLAQVTPTEASREQKRLLYNTLSHFVTLVLGREVSLHLAGSTAYDADAAGSDLDVVLLTRGFCPDAVGILQHLRETIEQMQRQMLAAAAADQRPPSAWPLLQVQLQLVESARVPILTLRTRGGSVVCDVSVNTANSIWHSEFFGLVLQRQPHLRPLMRLMKVWARNRKLPTMKEGGLPSIVWMILVAFLCFQQQQQQQQQRDANAAQGEEAALGQSDLAETEGRRSDETEALPSKRRDPKALLVELVGVPEALLGYLRPLLLSLLHFFSALRSRRCLSQTLFIRDSFAEAASGGALAAEGGAAVSAASGAGGGAASGTGLEALLQKPLISSTPKRLDESEAKVLSVYGHGGVWEGLLSVFDAPRAGVLPPVVGSASAAVAPSASCLGAAQQQPHQQQPPFPAAVATAASSLQNAQQTTTVGQAPPPLSAALYSLQQTQQQALQQPLLLQHAQHQRHLLHQQHLLLGAPASSAAAAASAQQSVSFGKGEGAVSSQPPEGAAVAFAAPETATTTTTTVTATAATPALSSAAPLSAALQAAAAGMAGGDPALDMAARVSSGTWLVYRFELCRGLFLLDRYVQALARFQALQRLLHGQVAQQQQHQQHQHLHLHSDGVASSPTEALLSILREREAAEKAGGASVAAAAGTAQYQQQQQHKQSSAAASLLLQAELQAMRRDLLVGVAAIFEELSDDRYLLPLLQSQQRNNNSSAPEPSAAPLPSQSQVSLRRRPSLCCSLEGRNGLRLRLKRISPDGAETRSWLVAAVEGRLVLLRAHRCCQEGGWWSSEFLSRRDVRSALHADLFTLLPLTHLRGALENACRCPPPSEAESLPSQETQQRRCLCPSHSFLERERQEREADLGRATRVSAAEVAAADDDGVALFCAEKNLTQPALLLPVLAAASGGAAVPVQVLFAPCNFVSRVTVLAIEEEDEEPATEGQEAAASSCSDTAKSTCTRLLDAVQPLLPASFADAIAADAGGAGGTASVSSFRGELFLLPSEEVARLYTLQRIAATAPWWHARAQQLSLHPLFPRMPLQPVSRRCRYCGGTGASGAGELARVAEYEAELAVACRRCPLPAPPSVTDPAAVAALAQAVNNNAKRRGEGGGGLFGDDQQRRKAAAALAALSSALEDSETKINGGDAQASAQTAARSVVAKLLRSQQMQQQRQQPPHQHPLHPHQHQRYSAAVAKGGLGDRRAEKGEEGLQESEEGGARGAGIFSCGEVEGGGPLFEATSLVEGFADNPMALSQNLSSIIHEQLLGAASPLHQQQAQQMQQQRQQLLRLQERVQAAAAANMAANCAATTTPPTTTPPTTTPGPAASEAAAPALPLRVAQSLKQPQLHQSQQQPSPHRHQLEQQPHHHHQHHPTHYPHPQQPSGGESFAQQQQARSWGVSSGPCAFRPAASSLPSKTRDAAEGSCQVSLQPQPLLQGSRRQQQGPSSIDTRSAASSFPRGEGRDTEAKTVHARSSREEEADGGGASSASRRDGSSKRPSVKTAARCEGEAGDARCCMATQAVGVGGGGEGAEALFAEGPAPPSSSTHSTHSSASSAAAEGLEAAFASPSSCASPRSSQQQQRTRLLQQQQGRERIPLKLRAEKQLYVPGALRRQRLEKQLGSLSSTETLNADSAASASLLEAQQRPASLPSSPAAASAAQGPVGSCTSSERSLLLNSADRDADSPQNTPHSSASPAAAAPRREREASSSPNSKMQKPTTAASAGARGAGVRGSSSSWCQTTTTPPTATAPSSSASVREQQRAEESEVSSSASVGLRTGGGFMFSSKSLASQQTPTPRSSAGVSVSVSVARGASSGSGSRSGRSFKAADASPECSALNASYAAGVRGLHQSGEDLYTPKTPAALSSQALSGVDNGNNNSSRAGGGGSKGTQQQQPHPHPLSHHLLAGGGCASCSSANSPSGFAGQQECSPLQQQLTPHSASASASPSSGQVRLLHAALYGVRRGDASRPLSPSCGGGRTPD